MSKVEEFEELRPLLFSIAYRILGSVGEAEDAVQETWLRFEGSATRPTSTKALLSAAVTRISIDVLCTRRADPGDPLSDQSRQARARGPGGGRLGDRPGSRTGTPATE
nr:sigma factor [Microtetraspora niveoalba]